ncbi:MAG: fibronectin type III domain-containing protein, partial [Candidatus Nanopelagicales bacterium]
MVLADAPGESAEITVGASTTTIAGLTAELARLGAATGDIVTVTTAEEGSGRTVVPGSGLLAEPAVTPQGVVPEDHEVTLVMATWPGADDATKPTTDQARQTITASADYWRTVSAQQINFVPGAVHENVALSTSLCSLGYSELMQQLQLQTGWTPGPSKHVVVAGAHCTENGWGVAAGWGSVGSHVDSGGYVILNGTAGIGNRATGSTAHELGHNISLGHAQEVACASGGMQVVDGPADGCRAIEYGNKYSIMGGLSGAPPMVPSAPELARLGLTGGALRDIATGSAALDITLAPVGGISGTRFARFTDAHGDTYYLEYRSAVGPDAPTLSGSPTPRLPSGVVISKEFVEADGTPFRAGSDIFGAPLKVISRDSYQLDANPLSNPVNPSPTESGGYDGDPVLPIGHVQFLGQGSVIVHSQDASGARITIDLSQAPKATAPQAPRNVNVARSGADGARATFTRPASDGGAYITRYTVTATPGGATCTAVDERGCVVSPLTAGVTYSFTVTAGNLVGTSAGAPSGAPGVVIPIAPPLPTVTVTPTPTVIATASPTAAPAQVATPAPTISATQTYSDLTADTYTGCGIDGYEPCDTYTDCGVDGYEPCDTYTGCGIDGYEPCDTYTGATAAAVETYAYGTSGYETTYGSTYGAT